MRASSLVARSLAAAILAGCATREAPPEPVSAADFTGWPCDAIADEVERVQQRAADVAYTADPVAGNNVIIFTLGTQVFWPALLAMRPDGADGAELHRLKARAQALDTAARLRSCPPPSDSLPPVRPAALPVALGERLVYEERPAAGGPTREVGLRLQALKRGEMDFLLDRPGSPPALWRQDAAGNVLGPQPHHVLAWSHLLRRDLALGDVLGGELHGAEGAEGAARVRGQVIALGPTLVSGHAFDTATIELFGEIAGGAPGARVDGVMVVDRASGVLLRLELKSTQAGYALRRKLVRIEPAA